MGRFLLEWNDGHTFPSYEAAWARSVEDLDGFWACLWGHFDVESPSPAGDVRVGGAIADTSWFPGVGINFAAHLLREARGTESILAYSQTRGPVALSAEDLADQVGRARAGLQRLGVVRGDRVVAYLPNIPETIIAFLATASLGAVWASAPPEFGDRSVVDRFSQIGPKVLLSCDGYVYGAKELDRLAGLDQLLAALPTVEHVVVVPYLRPPDAADLRCKGIPDSVHQTLWPELLAVPGELSFEPVSFDHPLFVLFSSGTTGLPKPIVHGHGGILLEHLKALALHADLGPEDRFFWFTTTGWVMWNILVSGLLTGASVVLFDGDPLHPGPEELWRIAAEARVTYFGTSPLFLMTCRARGVHPGRAHDLSTLRAVGSTGAPLPVEAFRWIEDEVRGDIPVWSMSGGTDIASAFVGGSPLVPVWPGELSCKYLGCRVESFDEDGNPTVGEPGELVVTAPLPSMPVGLWGDANGDRLYATYFDHYPGIWRHGDWIEFTARGSAVISGRSDATLNRGGVRLGTSELYSVIEAVPGVRDSLVVHVDVPDDVAGRLLLFIELEAGVALGDLQPRIVAAVRSQLSPRHVPDEVHVVPAIPRTLTGKKMEVPVKRILSGTPVEEAAALASTANPAALEPFRHVRSGS